MAANYQFILNSNSCVSNKTNDINYALFWLFNNINSNSDNYIDILLLIDNDNYIYEGSFKFNNGLIRYHKLYPNDYTRYSPYDFSIFKRADLCLLYLNILNNNTTTPQTTTPQTPTPHTPTPQTTTPQTTTPQTPINNPITQKQSLQKKLKNTLKNSYNKCKELSKLNNNYNSDNYNYDNDNDKFSNSDSEVNSEDIKHIEEELNIMLQNQQELSNELKNKQEQLIDIVCNQNYEKKIAFRNAEKEKEKRNIFSSDLRVYKKLLEDYNDINKENEKNNSKNIKLYDIIPFMFLAKFYVLEYIDINGYLTNENVNSPSDELYQIFDTLYTIKYNSNDDPNILDKYDEDLYDLIFDFLDYAEDKNALNDTMIREELNKRSDIIPLL